MMFTPDPNGLLVVSVCPECNIHIVVSNEWIDAEGTQLALTECTNCLLDVQFDIRVFEPRNVVKAKTTTDGSVGGSLDAISDGLDDKVANGRRTGHNGVPDDIDIA